MTYLGEYGWPGSYEVGCNGCGKKVRGKEPPRTWLTDTDRIPMEHFCPKCRRLRRVSAPPAATKRRGR